MWLLLQTWGFSRDFALRISIFSVCWGMKDFFPLNASLNDKTLKNYCCCCCCWQIWGFSYGRFTVHARWICSYFAQQTNTPWEINYHLAISYLVKSLLKAYKKKLKVDTKIWVTFVKIWPFMVMRVTEIEWKNYWKSL